MMIDLSDCRQSYLRDSLSRSELDAHPLDQFQKWFKEARQCPEIKEPNAMTVSTFSSDRVHARVVLLKSVEEEGFHFFTNYDSRKGRDIQAHPWVALSFFWAPLERQVLVSGRAEKLSRSESEAYFQSRPRESQLGAWVSPQSTVIESRSVLDKRFLEIEAQFEGREVPIPDYWGGFVVKPSEVEFWQGRANRLHDRFRYTLEHSQWNIQRLAP